MAEQIANAAAAYANAALRANRPGMEARTEAPGGSFGDMVQDMIGGVIESQHTAEDVSAAALVGRADINDVVLAINNAEIGLQAVVGVRDRIIQAYQDILRMPI
ncbi:MAG: flagellar hook-basal body complex protein FliE [Rhodospirillaceae bacterium]|nr:flagellar hook-basal body complex protein FliE [Rhodospirillaceae bacterium]